MKHKSVLLLLAFTIFVSLSGCEKIPPLSERIAKTWRAGIVLWSGTTVYSRGGLSNTTAGYTNYSLQLTTAGSVILREFTGETFNGQWELVGESTLVLKNLSPAPTGTNGTLEYKIDSISDTELKLSSTTAYAKTGDKTVTLNLQVVQ